MKRTIEESFENKASFDVVKADRAYLITWSAAGSRQQAGRFVAAWHLVVPAEVYERSWEELR